MALKRIISCKHPSRDLHVIGLLPLAQASITWRSGGGKSLATEIRAQPKTVGECAEHVALPHSITGVEIVERNVGFVLSSHFCRFLSVPWSDDLPNETSGAAYLRRTFLDTYGECAGEWEIACADEGYGQPRVACAIDRPALDAIRERCTARQLAFVRPYFSAAYNLFRAQIGGSKAVFATVEVGAMAIGRVLDGAVVEVEVLVGDERWQNSLSAWLARNALLDDDPGSVFVACPPALQDEEPADAAKHWSSLQWPKVVRDAVAEHPALALPACAL